MNKLKLALFAIVFSSFHSMSVAADYDLVGIGLIKCGVWLKTRTGLVKGSSLEDMAYESSFIAWSQGFLSGVNFLQQSGGNKVPFLPDPATLRAYLDKHCRDNPLDSILEANVQLLTDLMKRK